MAKKWYESWTIWAGILEISIGVLYLIENFYRTGDYTEGGFILLFVGILKIFLRFITKVPLEK